MFICLHNLNPAAQKKECSHKLNLLTQQINKSWRRNRELIENTFEFLMEVVRIKCEKQKEKNWGKKFNFFRSKATLTLTSKIESQLRK